METKDKSNTYGKRQDCKDLAVDLGTSDAESDNPKQGLCSRLKESRKRLSMSQTTFATATNIPLKTLKKYEAGTISPGSDALKGIAVLGINTNWLLTGDGPMLLKDMTEAPPPPAVDAEVLEGVIEGVEASLAKHRLMLPPAKKAHLIGVLYDYYRATGIGSAQGQQGGVAVDRFLKLVT